MLRNQNLIDGESNFLLDQQQGQRFRSTQSNAVKELIAQHLTVQPSKFKSRCLWEKKMGNGPWKTVRHFLLYSISVLPTMHSVDISKFCYRSTLR